MFWLTPDFRGALTNSAIGVILCLSVVVVTGLVGQMSLAPMAFAGISAFLVAELATDHGRPFPWPILAGALAATIVGVVVAVPALRIRGVNLAIVTLAFGLAMDRFVFDNPTVNGGVAGATVERPHLIDQTRSAVFEVGPFTIGDGKQPNPLTAVFCILVALVLCYAVVNLRRSTSGRQMLAVRANERAAAAAGVDVARTKTLAFAVSAFVAGLGGAVIAYRQGARSRARSATRHRSASSPSPTWAGSPESRARCWAAGWWPAGCSSPSATRCWASPRSTPWCWADWA